MAGMKTFAAGLAMFAIAGCAGPGASIPEPLVLAADAVPMQIDCTLMSMTPDPGAAAPGLTVAQSALLGEWVDGVWPSGRCHALSVEAIAADGTAQVVFATGASDVAPPVARRATGSISEAGVLRFTLPDGGEASYALDGDILRGILRRDGTMAPVALRRG